MLFTAELEDYFSISRAVKFTEVNSLPGAEIKAALTYEELLAGANYRAFEMGVGIALGVPESWAVLRDEFG